MLCTTCSSETHCVLYTGTDCLVSCLNPFSIESRVKHWIHISGGDKGRFHYGESFLLRLVENFSSLCSVKKKKKKRVWIASEVLRIIPTHTHLLFVHGGGSIKIAMLRASIQLSAFHWHAGCNVPAKLVETLCRDDGKG